ncbi:ribonuclease M5 [Mesoplasma photuris]|uniref:ribonuclease M5 n=1 Tax=Mesoplasma photuris TaxID=217731 RepID=UPI0004E1A0B8|nr:ribonuclease M5 [Mesoplasma photuris]
MEVNKIKQIIIVEGKTDTDKLKKIFGNDIKTIETNGLGINETTLSFIKEMNDKVGVIIFTDPDGPGKKIREKIINYLDGEVLNAFIKKDNINQNSKKIGIAEADDESIKLALKNLITLDKDSESITWSEYLNNDLFIKKNRDIIAKHYNWNEKISSKTFFKWLNWSNVTLDQLLKILESK